MRTYLSVLVVAAATLILYLYNVLCLRPEKLRRALRRQGITGPQPSFLLGNIRDMKRPEKEEIPRGEGNGETVHDFSSTFFPFFDRWRKIYGNYNSTHLKT